MDVADSPSVAPAVASPLHVVLFSGGRGADALVQRLAADARVRLTIAVNGYDDGASTGEVRRFLGDCLGPSDFRKNASRVARVLRTAHDALTTLLDSRLPSPCEPAVAGGVLDVLAGRRSPGGELEARFGALVDRLPAAVRADVVRPLSAFEEEYRRTGRPFVFDDCAVGNIVFAGAFLLAGRAFNVAVDAYCALCGVPAGMIDNVTDGTNAYLVAIGRGGEVLATEADIVDARRRNVVREIYLIRSRLAPPDVAWLESVPFEEADAALGARSAVLQLNSRLAERLAAADLIIFAPGTQHSSLFPSYLTPGLSPALAANVRAHKLMLTNLQADAEIHGASGVDLVERALYYLREKNRRPFVTPSLITLCLINEPAGPSEVHVLPGPIDRLEDLRLIRIANYEDGDTGRHDSDKVLVPLLDELLERRTPKRMAVLLTDSESEAKLAQTVLEMVRGGLADLGLHVQVFYARSTPLDPFFTASVPLAVRRLDTSSRSVTRAFLEACVAMQSDYVALVDSSGMYNGEDVARLAAVVASRNADAVWGSRRLSLREIHASYRLRYRHTPLLGLTSYLGSHLLSAAYLVLHGRYVSDTLSEVRACRLEYVADLDVTDALVNHRLLSLLLGNQAEIVEVPVQFLPLSPRSVRRTTVGDGLRALATIVAWRFRPRARVGRPAASGGATARQAAVTTPAVKG
jgi:2-phospho-L-lactate transferase/gluconeogenesis factor (CofD/UPF0052 family)